MISLLLQDKETGFRKKDNNLIISSSHTCLYMVLCKNWHLELKMFFASPHSPQKIEKWKPNKKRNICSPGGQWVNVHLQPGGGVSVQSLFSDWLLKGEIETTVNFWPCSNSCGTPSTGGAQSFAQFPTQSAHPLSCIYFVWSCSTACSFSKRGWRAVGGGAVVGGGEREAEQAPASDFLTWLF